MELDAVKLDPNRYKLVLENRLVRVMRLRFEAREAGSMVRHPPRVLATLTHVWKSCHLPTADETNAACGLKSRRGWKRKRALD